MHPKKIANTNKTQWSGHHKTLKLLKHVPSWHCLVTLFCLGGKNYSSPYEKVKKSEIIIVLHASWKNQKISFIDRLYLTSEI